jgi:hypothetical protein
MRWYPGDTPYSEPVTLIGSALLDYVTARGIVWDGRTGYDGLGKSSQMVPNPLWGESDWIERDEVLYWEPV